MDVPGRSFSFVSKMKEKAEEEEEEGRVEKCVQFVLCVLEQRLGGALKPRSR
jgi:hypothetical protein